MQRLKPSQVFLGDALQAMHDLQPEDSETREMILRMLDLGPEVTAPPEARADEHVIHTVSTDRTKKSPLIEESVELTEVDEAEDEEEEEGPTTEELEEEELPPDLQARGSGIVPIRIDTTSTAPRGPSFGVALPRIPPQTDEEHEELPPALPLLEASWTRALLTVAMSTEAFDGEADIEAMVDILARGSMPQSLPRLPIPTMRQGVQLLVDRGAGLVPFARDVEALSAAIAAVAGADSLRLLRFRGTPGNGVYDAVARAHTQYEPPPHGVPVLLITDFGIAANPFVEDAAPLSEWIAFLSILRQREHAVIAFVPYPRSRWPYALTRMATLLEWDRRTTVLHVQTARRRSRRR